MGETLFEISRALFAVALAGKGLFGATLFTRFQVKRVPLDFLNNVFLLNLAFEAAQRTFKSFTILQMDFGQLEISPPSGSTPSVARAHPLR